VSRCLPPPARPPPVPDSRPPPPRRGICLHQLRPWALGVAPAPPTPAPARESRVSLARESQRSGAMHGTQKHHWCPAHGQVSIRMQTPLDSCIVVVASRCLLISPAPTVPSTLCRSPTVHPPSQNICTFGLLHITFDHSSYSKFL
jgi:hypothetical protein